MSNSGLDQAREAVHQLAQRPDLDGATRQDLLIIARGLQETDERLRAIEVLIEELAARATITSSGDIIGCQRANWNYLRPLLRRNRV